VSGLGANQVHRAWTWQLAKFKITWAWYVCQTQVPDLPDLQALDMLYIYIVFFNNPLFVYIFSKKKMVYVLVGMIHL
jgi:hypothetical protein